MRFSHLSFLLLLILPILLYFVTHGAVMSDEGNILHSAEKILNGKLPYRDFHFQTTPASLFLTVIPFSLLKSSILSSRLLVLAVYLISSILIFKTVFIATKNNLYATISILIFISWAPSHVNFSYPTVYAIAFTILCCYLLMKFMQTRRKRYLFFAGISSFLVLLSEHHIGIALILPVVIFFSVKHARSFSIVSIFLYAYLWSFILFCIYLLSNQSFPQFVSDFFRSPIQFNNSLFAGSVFQNFLNFMPLIISVASFVLLYIRRRFHLLFLPSILVFFFTAIVFSQDYVQSMLFMSLLGIPVALYLRYNVSTNVRLLLLLFSCILIFSGFYTGLFKGYYNTSTSLVENSNFFPHPKVNIFIEKKTEHELSELIDVADKYTGPKDYVFINSYDPMLYFILNRKDPINETYILAEQSPKKYYAQVVGNLVAKRVRILLLKNGEIDSLPIKNFIRNNYSFTKTVGHFDIYLLRS